MSRRFAAIALASGLAVLGAKQHPALAAPPESARLAAELGAIEPARRARAARELSALDPEAARPLVRRALDDLDGEVRAAATLAAGQLELTDLAPILIGRAGSADARLREATIEALGRLRPSAETDSRPIEVALGRALTDAELGVRAAALRGLSERQLGATNRASIVEAIAGCLSDERPELRQAAAESLEWLADPLALHALAARVDDPSPEVRAAVARALGALGDARAAPAVGRLTADGAEEVRGAAITTLGLLGDPGATARLAPILERPRDPLAGAAAIALGRIVGRSSSSDDAVAKTLRARAAAALSDAALGDANRAAAIEGLRASGPEAAVLLARLLPALGARPLDEILLLAAELSAAGDAKVTALLLERARLSTDARFDAALTGARPPQGEVRTALVTWLASRLGDPGVAARRAAATALGALGDARAVRALEAAVADRDGDVRRAALLALASTSAAPGPLLISTARSSDAELAHAALSALAHRRDEPSRQVLVEALGRGDPTAERIAAFGLSDDAGASSAVPALLALLSSGPPSARAAAVLALLGPLRARPNAVARELCLSIAATDDPAAAGAVELLGAMRDVGSADRLTGLLPKLGKRPLRRARLYATLGDLLAAGAQVEHTLLAALDDPDPSIRLSAAWALGKARKPSDGVERALGTHLADSSAAVRANALGALARLGRPPAPALLARLARDREPALVANAVRLGAPLGAARSANAALPPLFGRAQALATRALPRGHDYLHVRAVKADAHPVAARIGLPDGLVEIVPVDERGFLRDEAVASGDLIVDFDETLLR